MQQKTIKDAEKEDKILGLLYVLAFLLFFYIQYKLITIFDYNVYLAGFISFLVTIVPVGIYQSYKKKAKQNTSNLFLL
tara:strand:- start:4292 stop:4525 length:234 start_codon:yes stop_codon:yes gene_type:complete